jgi:hypothetical protein
MPPYISMVMKPDIIALPEFTCIGLQAEGPIVGELEWVTHLWLDFQERSAEIRHLGCRGVWGLTSDPTLFLAPWGGRTGSYLASWQVPRGTEPFADWQVWTIPAGTWLRIHCRIGHIKDALELGREQLRTSLEWQWSGAVHEFSPATFRDPGLDDIHLMMALSPR